MCVCVCVCVYLCVVWRMVGAADYEDRIGIVDVATNTFSFLPTAPAGVVGTHKFAGALAVNPHVYLAPRDSEFIGVLSPAPPPRPPPRPPPPLSPPPITPPPLPSLPPHAPPPLPPSLLLTLLGVLMGSFATVAVVGMICALCRAYRIRKRHQMRMRRHLVQGGSRQRTSMKSGRALIDPSLMLGDPADAADSFSEPSEASPERRDRGVARDDGAFASIMPVPPSAPRSSASASSMSPRKLASARKLSAVGSAAAAREDKRMGFSLARLRAALDGGASADAPDISDPAAADTAVPSAADDAPKEDTNLSEAGGVSPVRSIPGLSMCARTPTGAGVLDTPTRIESRRGTPRRSNDSGDEDSGAGVLDMGGSASARGTPSKVTPTRGVLQQARHAALHVQRVRAVPGCVGSRSASISKLARFLIL